MSLHVCTLSVIVNIHDHPPQWSPSLRINPCAVLSYIIPENTPKALSSHFWDWIVKQCFQHLGLSFLVLFLCGTHLPCHVNTWNPIYSKGWRQLNDGQEETQAGNNGQVILYMGPLAPGNCYVKRKKVRVTQLNCSGYLTQSNYEVAIIISSFSIWR